MSNTDTIQAGERTQHTAGPWEHGKPGPWEHGKPGAGRFCIYAPKSHGRGICVLSNTQKQSPAEVAKYGEHPANLEADANARLIAKSPQLFAFVKDYFDQADCGNGGEHTEIDGDKAQNCWHCTARRLVEAIEGRS